MRKILLIILLFFPIVIYSQPKDLDKNAIIFDSYPNSNSKLYKDAGVKTQTEWKQPVSGKKMKTFQKNFDQNGKLTQWISYSADDSRSSGSYYTYNDDGLLSESKDESYTNDSPSSSNVIKYSYDKLKRPVTVTAYSFSKKTFSTIKEYDDKANTFTIRDFNGDSILVSSRTYFYNTNGYITQMIFIDNNGQGGKNTYEYSGDSVKVNHFQNDILLKIEMIFFDNMHNTTKVTTTVQNHVFYDSYLAEYNSMGLNTLESSVDVYGKEEWRYVRSYDSKGNQIEEDYFMGNKILTSKKLSHYDENNLITESVSGDKDTDFNKDKLVYTYKYY